LAILVLRIGGPRLLWTFNKLNYLPSASLMYCKLKNKIKINTSITCSIEQQVEENIQQFFNVVMENTVVKSMKFLRQKELVLIQQPMNSMGFVGII
jgi:hypothetical protein